MTAPSAYITTPIYYVNDKPHIGHVYTTTVCDVYARFMRFAGRDVFFLTGTDEHGIKVEKSARAAGLDPQRLADQNAAEFQRALGLFELTNDDFIRTTEERHVRQVAALITRLLDEGHIYLGSFEGWYDEGQEEYYTDTRARELGYKSPVNRQPLVRAAEENYYFRLSAFQEPLEKLFAEHPEFVRPEARRNETLARIREGLQDVPMTRTNFTWGIPMPRDPDHVIYVWIDALMNYITALGLGEDGTELHKQRSGYWPATYHVIGKEILWFHAVIWPAILMALKFPLPRCIYAHSFWISEGQKMSKSLGNFIDLPTIGEYLDRYGLDAWRYYLATKGPLGSTDANFTAAHFHEVYHTDLVNTLGNCASRVTAMVNKYFDGVIPPAASQRLAPEQQNNHGYDWPAITAEAQDSAFRAMERFDLAEAAAAVLSLVRRIDGFINQTEPYKVARDPSPEAREELAAILARTLEALRIASLLLWAVSPQRMADLWEALGLSIDPAEGRLSELARWGAGPVDGPVRKVALFPRVNEPVPATAPPSAAAADSTP